MIQEIASAWSTVECPSGYALASVHSAAEQQAIELLLDGTSNYWLGLNDVVDEMGSSKSGWVSSDGTQTD